MNNKLNQESNTKLIRNQIERTQFQEHSVPLYLTSSFVFEDAEQMRAAFAEEVEHNIYSRYSNPNVNEFTQKIADMGVNYGETEFSAQLPQNHQEAKVQELIGKGLNINFVQFTPTTVVPENMHSWKGSEHMYSFDYAYKLKSVRDWLFKQSK